MTTIGGYAALYGRPTLIGEARSGYGFRETIATGAFAGVLNDGRTYAAFNHEPSLILARLSAGNLRLRSDAKGLAYEVDLPDTSAGRDLSVMVGNGMVVGSSFAFRVATDGDVWTRGSDGIDERVIYRFERLIDVSPVVSPAYEDTASEGALAPVAGRKATPKLDARVRLAERLLWAEASMTHDPALTRALVGQAGKAPRPTSASAPASLRDSSRSARERRLVPVGAIERRYLVER